MIFALRPAAWCFAPFYLMTERHGRDANPPPPGRNRWLWVVYDIATDTFNSPADRSRRAEIRAVR
jgi:hypothetical protein